MFGNSETETCNESYIVHFPINPLCSSKVDVLETGAVPTLFSLYQMKNLGTTIALDPKGDKITCPAFGLYSSPAEQSGHPKRHVTFAMSERRPAFPAHAPDMDEDKDEDDNHLCDQHQGRNLLKKRAT